MIWQQINECHPANATNYNTIMETMSTAAAKERLTAGVLVCPCPRHGEARAILWRPEPPPAFAAFAFPLNFYRRWIVPCYNHEMVPKLSDEQRLAIHNRDGGPVEVEDDRTQRVYVLVARDEFHRLVEEQLRAELQVGFDQADAGDVGDWNVEEML